MEYSIAEAGEIANAKANTFQNLGFVIAAFGKTVCVMAIKRSEDFISPVVNSFCTSMEF